MNIIYLNYLQIYVKISIINKNLCYLSQCKKSSMNEITISVQNNMIHLDLQLNLPQLKYIFLQIQIYIILNYQQQYPNIMQAQQQQSSTALKNLRSNQNIPNTSISQLNNNNLNTQNSITFLQMPNTISIHSYSHSISATGNMLKQADISNNKQIYLSFVIKPLQSLYLNSQNNKNVLKLNLGQFIINITASKKQKQYQYQTGLYSNYLNFWKQYQSEIEQVGIKEIICGQWTSVTITIDTCFIVNGESIRLEECFPVIQLGHKQKDKCLQFQIKNIKLSTKKQVNITSQNTQPSIKQYNLPDRPLDTIPSTQIPQISSLPLYHSPQQKPDKLYLCHDMKGGYLLDVDQNCSYLTDRNHGVQPQLIRDGQYSYRNLHLAQASIFNYFSHYVVSIPPKTWRRACRESRTLCLGTYLIQKVSPHQSIFLTDYTVKMLAYFCRKYRFDGYLINFQYRIQSVYKLLIPWLKKLTNELHQAVPGSKIIWYDSVTRDGDVKYQNQLNQANFMFYKICDGIFLNYWWDQNKIQNSIKNAIEGKPIYVGNDCWGRGTFGGGQLNIYKAINAIQKANNGQNWLAPALFAPAWTHEQSNGNVQKWKMLQKGLYRGMSSVSQQLGHDNWQYLKEQQNGFTWKRQGDWMVTSFENCQRAISFKLKLILGSLLKQSGFITLVFSTVVCGTGPKYQDLYRISMVVTEQKKIVLQTTTKNQTASQKQKNIELRLSIDSSKITQQTVLSIIEEGHDIEHFGGHYGTRFKKDQFYATKYTKQNDWIAKYTTNFPNGVSLPYLTNYNLGHGKNFNFEGKPIKKNYQNLSDYSTNFTYLMNPPSWVSIYHNDAYIGGTSLLVQQTQKIKLIVLQIDNKYKGKTICVRNVIKWITTDSASIKTTKLNYKWPKDIKQKSEGKYATVKAINQKGQGWIQYNYKIQLNEQIQQNPCKLILYIQTFNIMSYLIGQTAIYIQQPLQQISQKSQIKSIIIYPPVHSTPIIPFLFNIQITMSYTCRLLIKINDSFSCFCYADQYNYNVGTVQNILFYENIQKQQQKSMIKKSVIVMKVLALNNRIQYEIIKQVEIPKSSIMLQKKIQFNCK